MKVYVFVAHDVADFEDFGISTKVFTKKEDAVAYLKEYRDEQMEYVERDEMEIEYDIEDHFCAYEYGNWAKSHIEAYVEEHDVI